MTLAAPSVVMSAVLGWSLPVTVLVICVPMIFYTTLGAAPTHDSYSHAFTQSLFYSIGVGIALALLVQLLPRPKPAAK